LLRTSGQKTALVLLKSIALQSKNADSQGLTGKDILFVEKAALPFFFLLLFAVIVAITFPQTVTWLPMTMTN